MSDEDYVLEVTHSELLQLGKKSLNSSYIFYLAFLPTRDFWNFDWYLEWG